MNTLLLHQRKIAMLKYKTNKMPRTRSHTFIYDNIVTSISPLHKSLYQMELVEILRINTSPPPIYAIKKKKKDLNSNNI